MTTTVLPASTSRCEDLEQLLDVVEVQAGGRLVEDVERAAGRALESSVASFTRWASPPDSVVAGWPSAHVVEADVVAASADGG